MKIVAAPAVAVVLVACSDVAYVEAVPTDMHHHFLRGTDANPTQSRLLSWNFFRKTNKVTMCRIIEANPVRFKTIKVKKKRVNSRLKKGDMLGSCSESKNCKKLCPGSTCDTDSGQCVGACTPVECATGESCQCRCEDSSRRSLHSMKKTIKHRSLTWKPRGFEMCRIDQTNPTKFTTIQVPTQEYLLGSCSKNCKSLCPGGDCDTVNGQCISDSLKKIEECTGANTCPGQECICECFRSDPVIVQLETPSSTSFNPKNGNVCIRIANAEVDVASSSTLSVNGESVDAAKITTEPNLVCATGMSFVDGINDVSFRSAGTNGEDLSLDTVFYAGSSSVAVQLTDALGATYTSEATVTARLGDDERVTETVVTTTGSVFFENLPDRTILFAAEGATAETGTAATVPNGASPTVTIQLLGFNEPTTVDNKDFSLGLEGWETSDPSGNSIVSHLEAVGPVLGIPSSRRLDTIANADLLLSTNGKEGPSITTHTFTTKPGTGVVRLRYRFVTSEVPGGYFGTQYNDYYAISIRSQNGGDIMRDTNTMNGLGLEAFDEEGSTSWHDVTLKVDSSNTDTIQIDLLVANVADGDFQSELFVDYVSEIEESGDDWTKAIIECNNDPLCAFGRLKGGVAASQNFALLHSKVVSNEMLEKFSQVAEEYNIPVAVLMAIASRETNMGTYLGAVAGCPDGWGDKRDNECWGFGLMQVDKGSHTIEGTEDPFSIDHLRQAAGIFADYRTQVSNKHNTWSSKYILKGAAVAYNSGVGNVQTIATMDVGTTGDDYGSDVITRALWFYLNMVPGFNKSVPDPTEPPKECDTSNPHPASTIAPADRTQTNRWTLRAKFIVGAINECFPGRYYMSTYIDDGDHGAGNAIDVFPGKYGENAIGGDKDDGDMLAEWAKMNAADLKIQYVIWYRKIWNIDVASQPAGTFEDCCSRSRCMCTNDATKGHFDHIHISVK